MAATRTPGITLDAHGDLILDKEYRGNRLFRRLGKIAQDEAERILQKEIARLTAELDLRMHARPLLRHCAARYLAESKQKRTVDTIAWHVRLLLAHFSDFHPERIHDGSLQPFIELRQTEGAGATTINRSLEVMRTILNRAARAYHDDDGRPWLERVPTADFNAPRIASSALSNYVGRTRRPLPAPPRTPPADDTLRCQHRVTRKQRLRIAMALGGRRARGRSQCVRDST